MDDYSKIPIFVMILILFFLLVSYKINGAICTNFTAFDDLACEYSVDLYLTGESSFMFKVLR